MDLLLPGLGTLVWNTLFFLLTVAVLTKLAWKPILSMLDARDKSIEEALSDAQKARNELQGVKQESQNILREARGERDTILREAKEEGARIIEVARGEASIQAAGIIKDANAVIEREKRMAKEDLKKELAEISVGLAEKVLGEELEDSKKQQESLEKSIKEMQL
ncbi:MAG: F0F1 ATP synthase subunit B [Flavobacteriales bacterium]|nr:F0F1 ATP synthase subunit B [Flavobacteriales bacterium]MBQ8650885.1 F0F1 ATP synthase subunit B [Flavobacteriales bacterium]